MSTGSTRVYHCMAGLRLLRVHVFTGLRVKPAVTFARSGRDPPARHHPSLVIAGLTRNPNMTHNSVALRYSHVCDSVPSLTLSG